jgi:two-component system, cell cycle sensor histidine kinase and response regulator CckA
VAAVNDTGPSAPRLSDLEQELLQLRRENQAWRNAHAASPIAQIDVDANGRVVLVTTRAVELLRVDSAEQLLDKTLPEIFSDGQCSQISECMQQLDDGAVGERRCIIRGPGRRGRSPIWLRAMVTRSSRGCPGFVVMLTDVTDIELSRRELAADVDLFGALLQVAGVEFFEWQAQRPFRSSPGFRQLMGIRVSGILHDSLEGWVQRVHPDDRERMTSHWQETAVENAAPAEFRIVGDDGRTRWLRSAAIVRHNDEGKVSSISGVVRDVSAEHEARTTLLRLQTLVDTARAAILMVNGDGQVIMANRAFCRAVGQLRDRVLGSAMETYCFPEDIEQRRESVRSLLATGASSFAWRMRCAVGGERWYQVDASTFGEESQERRQFVFVGTDIDVARRERITMIERERWLDRVLRDAGIGAFRFDRARNESELVGAYSELYQQQNSHVVMPDEWLSMVLPEHRNRLSVELSRFLASETRATMDFPILLPDGNTRWLRAFLRNEGVYAERKGVLSSVVFDISQDRLRVAESEELQRQVYQAQKTESLGVMAGGIAHDLNNMLMAALGQLNLAVAAVPNESPLSRYLGTVESVLGRMEGLTERMLAYAGKSAAQMQPFDVARLLDSMEPLLRASCGHHSRLRIEIDSRPAVVLGDSTQVEQVLLNFVQNAVDAIGERGGQVRLRLSRVSADELRANTLQWPLREAEHYVELVVRDDGPGIGEDDIRRVFEPFYTTKTTGRGLGLSVVQGIVKAHGGSIKLLSEVGIGTEFRVYLPVLAGATADDAPEQQTLVPMDPRTLRPVLAIDDDEDVLAITVVMLEQCGLEVAAFLSGDEAITELALHPERYGCAIVDLTMPVKDGGSVARELREIVPTLPILFVSGYSKEQVAELVATNDSTHFLRKPFRVDGLNRALERLLQRD